MIVCNLWLLTVGGYIYMYGKKGAIHWWLLAEIQADSKLGISHH